MKKAYGKPLVSVEVMSLDMAVATSDCNLTNHDRKALKAMGYFLDAANCVFHNLLPTGGFDHNNDGIADSHDTICYHSNVTTVFVS